MQLVFVFITGWSSSLENMMIASKDSAIAMPAAMWFERWCKINSFKVRRNLKESEFSNNMMEHLRRHIMLCKILPNEEKLS